MRRLVALIALIGGCVAMPAVGQSTASALTDIGSGGAVAASARMPVLQPLAIGSSVERSARMSGNLRLRVGVAATAQGPRDRIHQRIASSMIDFYPVGSSGFHLSAGTKLYDVRAGEQATNRGLMVTQRQLNVPGGRPGLKRTPALTMGYTGQVAETSLGLEVGAMRGPVYTDMMRQTRLQRAADPINPMVNLVVGRRF